MKKSFTKIDNFLENVFKKSYIFTMHYQYNKWCWVKKKIKLKKLKKHG